MLYETYLTINTNKARVLDPVLFAELESWIFGDNYGKFCDIKKVYPTFLHEDNVVNSTYGLHFFNASDATAFKLRFSSLLEDNWNNKL